jgi:hypothetical protein
LFEFVGAQLQTALTGDLLIKTQTSENAAGLDQSETCRSELKDNVSALYGHEISIKDYESLDLHLGQDVCNKFIDVLKKDVKVVNNADLKAAESTNLLQSQICKYFILHLDDLSSKLSTEQLQELSQYLFKHTNQEQLRGYIDLPQKLEYAPWVFEHAYARKSAMLVDEQKLGDTRVGSLVKFGEMKDKISKKLQSKLSEYEQGAESEWGYITLADGRQLYSKPNSWVSTDLPDSGSNTDEARRLWKFDKNGIISL